MSESSADREFRIGVVGYSAQKFDVDEARAHLDRILRGVLESRQLAPAKVELVSGLTNLGVPKISYEVAVELGMITVGLSAARALRSSSGVFPVDKQIIVGENYGDESDEFIAYIDMLVRVGGGEQSHHEVKQFRDRLVGEGGDLDGRLVEVELPALPKD